MKKLTASNRAAIRELVYQCANYMRTDKYCLLLDVEQDALLDCPMLALREAEGVCAYFRAAVLPLNPALEADLTCKEPVAKRICAHCGKEFVPNNNRAQYCGEKCKTNGRRKKDRELRKEARNKAG